MLEEGHVVSTPRGRGRVLKQVGRRARVEHDSGSINWVEVKDISEARALEAATATDKAATDKAKAEAQAKRLHLNLDKCDAATHDRVAKILAELPTSLEVLTLENCVNLYTIEKLSELTALRTLNLKGCSSLGELPDLSHLVELSKVDLDGCTTLREGPKTSFVEVNLPLQLR
jgi:hypothetical protein